MSKLACLTRGKDRAFPAYPRVDRYFPAAAIEDARQRLARCIDRGDGPGLAVGPAGTGKTLLLQLLATQFADRFSVACLASTPLCTSRSLLQAILFELRQSYRDQDECELRLSLMELLLDREACPNGVLLLVDEAQLLPPELLDELRILSNIVCAGEPQVRMVLAGSLQLDEAFTSPELDVFNQRLAARCYLAPMSHAETVQYTRAQISAGGANPDELLSIDTLDAIYLATDGIPRLVNQVCDRALLLAVERSLRQIDKLVVEAAWADLQQLPMPSALASPTLATEAIEFGTLDDESQQDETEIDTKPDVAVCHPMMRVFQTPEILAAKATFEKRPPKHERRQSSLDDPFGESFQDEEIVLDRFASLEAAFHGNTPRVHNRRETSWSQLLRDADQGEIALEWGHPCELPTSTATVDAAADQLDEPQISRLMSQGEQEFQSPLNSAGADEPDLLLIEEDFAPPTHRNRQVERKDYRQLFASLRGD